MPASVLSAFLTFTFITAFTPGPNNILALNSGSRLGFRRSAPVLSGMCAGFLCVMLICGVTAFSLSALSDRLVDVMKYVGCAYIVWLAWKVGTAKPEEGGNERAAAKAGFLRGFVLQFVNIKIIIYGLAAFSGFVLPYYSSYLAMGGFTLVLTLIGCVGFLAWALTGSALQRFFMRYARAANITMGVMLLACAASMLV